MPRVIITLMLTVYLLCAVGCNALRGFRDGLEEDVDHAADVISEAGE